MTVLSSSPEPAEWTPAHRELLEYLPADVRGEAVPVWSVAVVVTEDVDGMPSGVQHVRHAMVTNAHGADGSAATVRP